MVIKPDMAQGHLPKALQQNPRGGLEEVFDIPMETAPLPAGEYLIAEWTAKLSLPAFSIGGSQTGLLDSMKGAVTGNATFNFQPVVIDNVQIEVKPVLKPGDRVLVAWGGRKEMIG